MSDLIQKVLEGKKLTTIYRDEINIQRYEIINNYSKHNLELGEFYYVYTKRDDNTFGIVVHKNGNIGTNIVVEKSKLPNDIDTDCVLRIKNGEFTIDEEATNQIQKELTEMIKRLIEEQNYKLESQRIEGHLYEFVEKTRDTVELIDITNNTEECFEEIDFPNTVFENAKQGDIFQYIKGEYKRYLNSEKF